MCVFFNLHSDFTGSRTGVPWQDGRVAGATVHCEGVVLVDIGLGGRWKQRTNE